MNNTIQLTDKGYCNHEHHTYDIGLQGQDFIEKKLLERGYLLYKKNFKKIGLEIDLILYKHLPEKDIVIIRILEVKTRNSVSLHKYTDLDSLKIDRKWLKIKKYMYGIVSDLKKELDFRSTKHVIHFDLALIAYNSTYKEREDGYRLYKYIEDVDLLI